MTLPDQVKIEKGTEVKHVEMVVSAANDVKVTTTYISNSKLKEWMSKPHRHIMDKDGSRMLDEKGAVMVNLPNSEMGLKAYNQIKQQIVLGGLIELAPDLQPITDPEIQQLKNDGYAVTKSADDRIITIKKGDTELIYNYSILSVEKKFYENGQPKFAIYDRYLRVDDGSLVPALKIEKDYVTMYDGTCAEAINQTTFTNFSDKRMAPPLNSRQKTSPTSAGSESFNISPNPTTNQITLSISPKSFGNIETVVLIDALGRVAKNISLQEINTAIDVSGLSKGLYFVKIKHKTGEIQQLKFIKQ